MFQKKGGIDWCEDTPRYYTKPQKTIQSPDRLHKAPTNYTKPRQTSQSPKKTTQSHQKYTKPIKQLYKDPNILDKSLTYSTRLANNIN